ncbi:DUF5687 family protein [Flavobacterium sp. SM15]|uniref:DUF5687 family protein n=1 Tax=Flavobacterium sp. SM15 TaxID=2908005 RepID=UPI001EDA2B0A|nr:DUF5687 family protein [Flavobacterium sp. SM15]MCG2610344.1 DUF5687 family protein [Flavobacterium sp. SM15]
MLKHFITLEWKSFLRSASFSTNVALKIFMIIGALYFGGCFLVLGAASYYMLEDYGLKPLETINQYLIYYFFFDLLLRFFMQKTPVMNIKPLLYINIKRKSIVNFALGKTLLSFFNVLHLFFFIPFSVVLLKEGFQVTGVLSWFFTAMTVVFFNNFLNILIDKKNTVFYTVALIFAGFGLSQYYQLFDITQYTGAFFNLIYQSKWVIVFPLLALLIIYWFTFRFFIKNLYLDEGLSIKQSEAKTEDLLWLNQFGTLGTFLKNDIKLIKRNKRSRATLFMSVIFIFYGLLFFTNSIEAYQNPMMQVFAGIFVSGGFLFTFGQFVPSWDSAYYPLMMSQNIQYKEYLNSKWWLIVIATIISTLVASFYLYFGWQIYMLIVVGAIYNIGVNAHLVLLGGAYVKKPIDLTSAKGAFGNSQGFNIQTFLISIPKLLVPMLLYWSGKAFFSVEIGLLFVALAGIAGFAFRNKMFALIEKVYKKEKYLTIAAYNQKD